MSNKERIARQARMLKSGLMPRNARGHMLKEGYPCGLHAWMQHNAGVR